jgi:hypothetical protein
MLFDVEATQTMDKLSHLGRVAWTFDGQSGYLSMANRVTFRWPIGLPFDCHHTGDGRLGIRRSPKESRENARVGGLAGELRLELTAD